jgi:uncharacterized protein (DUF488 family)
LIEPSALQLQLGDDGSVRTIDRGAVITVGYQGRDLSEVIAALSDAGVEVLIDVRLTPLSRKPGLSKSRLAEALKANGIEYLHLPVLGNPRDNREGYRNAESSALERFRQVLGSHDASSAVGHLRELAADKVIALLCFERDPSQCHRMQIVDAIAAASASGLGVIHL